MRAVPLEQRLLAKSYRADNGCLIWTGSKNADGYGHIGLNRSTVKTHRAAFFVANGRWPTNLLLHSCDTPACIEITHLFEGNDSDNIKDSVRKGRYNSAKRLASYERRKKS